LVCFLADIIKVKKGYF